MHRMRCGVVQDCERQPELHSLSSKHDNRWLGQHGAGPMPLQRWIHGPQLECMLCVSNLKLETPQLDVNSCVSGKYKASLGFTACADCQAHASSGPGASFCTCDPGWCRPAILLTSVLQDGLGLMVSRAPFVLLVGTESQLSSLLWIGTYKPTQGSASCTPCPANSNSASGASQLSQCLCIPGERSTCFSFRQPMFRLQWHERRPLFGLQRRQIQDHRRQFGLSPLPCCIHDTRNCSDDIHRLPLRPWLYGSKWWAVH